MTTEQYERIIRFLDAAMEPDEMDAFAKELAANPEMRHQLDFEQSVRDSLASRNSPQLPDTGMPSENPYRERTKNPGKPVSLWRGILLAAAVVIACLIMVVYWQKKKTNQPVAAAADTSQGRPDPSGLTTVPPPNDSTRLALLFTQYFQKDELPDAYPVFLAEALTDYQNGNYSTLEKLDFKSLPETRGINEMDSRENILKWGHYFKGIALLQTGNLREASSNLLWVLKNQPGKALRAKTQWYLALIFLKGYDPEKTTELCRRIVEDNENQILVTKAQKILESLHK